MSYWVRNSAEDSTMAGFDERQMERFTLQISANLFVISEENAKQITLETSNISAGGAFFPTDSPLPIGTKVKIDLVLPLGELKSMEGKRSRIHVSGAVIRTEDSGMAISFDKNYQISKLTGAE